MVGIHCLSYYSQSWWADPTTCSVSFPGILTLLPSILCSRQQIMCYSNQVTPFSSHTWTSILAVPLPECYSFTCAQLLPRTVADPPRQLKDLLTAIYIFLYSSQHFGEGQICLQIRPEVIESRNSFLSCWSLDEKLWLSGRCCCLFTNIHPSSLLLSPDLHLVPS